MIETSMGFGDPVRVLGGMNRRRGILTTGTGRCRHLLVADYSNGGGDGGGHVGDIPTPIALRIYWA